MNERREGQMRRKEVGVRGAFPTKSPKGTSGLSLAHAMHNASIHDNSCCWMEGQSEHASAAWAS